MLTGKPIGMGSGWERRETCTNASLFLADKPDGLVCRLQHFHPGWKQLWPTSHPNREFGLNWVTHSLSHHMLGIYERSSTDRWYPLEGCHTRSSDVGGSSFGRPRVFPLPRKYYGIILPRCMTVRRYQKCFRKDFNLAMLNFGRGLFWRFWYVF